MDTTDVDSNADRAQERFTNHFFAKSSLSGFSGTALRVPSNMSMWPPTALFDAVYASAVVGHFGSGLKDILTKWADVFYLGRPTEVAHTDKRPEECRAVRETHDPIDPHDVVMMYRFIAMEPENVRAYLKGCEEAAAAGKRKGLEEKVNSWRDGFVGTSNSISID